MARRKEGQILPDAILWEYSKNKDGLHPVKIRIIHHRVAKYYPIRKADSSNLFLSKEQYNKIVTTESKKLRGENRELKDTIDGNIQAAVDAIKVSNNSGKKPFSFAEFERSYLGSEATKNFLAYFERHIEKLAKKGQAGTVRAYSSAYASLKRFQNGRDFDPADLTVQKLEEFDEWLRTPRPRKSNPKLFTRPLNDTSVSIYMRCIRSIYNELAVNDEFLVSVYPFSKKDSDKKYKIPTESGGQKGITFSPEEMKLFTSGKVEGEEIPENPMFRAKKLFLFSFYAQGVNFKDLAMMRYSDLDKGAINLKRQKTIRTRRGGVINRIPLIDELKEILIEQGNPNKAKNSFIFEVFDSNKRYSPKEEDDKIRQWIKVNNKWLKKYCRLNGIPEASTYTARHTFASIAKNYLPIAQISKMLDHSRITTTQVYLGKFEDEQNREGLLKVIGSVKRKKA